MRRHDCAIDLIEMGESAVVIFTRGDNFERGAKGRGSTGDWAVDRARIERLDWVIVYCRDPLCSSGADVWRGRPAALEGAYPIASGQRRPSEATQIQDPTS